MKSEILIFLAGLGLGLMLGSLIGHLGSISPEKLIKNNIAFYDHKTGKLMLRVLKENTDKE